MRTVKVNPKATQLRFRAIKEKEKPSIVFHVDSIGSRNNAEFENNHLSQLIRFSDKLHERWDDLLDNFDDLSLK
ncbi:hypothetical protein NF867_15930 [Solitalea sp. MAHUQ-68]|uniref:Uncharacterized protein n=1 Tax=Solitalea agri TaxID=2953739 RepID=A0A9X2F4W4_9SPHI|nr:hypothetical protein [Solitalea agri]MCO4294351.1 hypothetical protein [Solitalea agri]